ncbi:MAG: MFS transporter [Clostridia bacterium]|nr:MFS transporter [Clostridia bacterium]
METKYLSDYKKSALLFILIFTSYSLVYMTKNCYSAAMASIVNEGIMTKSQTGLIAAVFYLLYAPFQIIGGIAADKYSPKLLLTIGYLGASIANLLVYLFHTNYVAMIIIWGFNAIIQFGIWPSVFKIVASFLAVEHRTKGIFLLSFCSTIGLFLSYLLAIFISDWKNHFLFSSLVLFLLTIIVYISYTILEKYMHTEEPLPDTQIEIPDNTAKISKSGTIRLMLISGLPIFLIINLISTMLSLGVKALSPVMLMESYAGITPGIASALNIILILAGPIGLFISKLHIFRRFDYPKSIAIFLFLSIPSLVAIVFVGELSVFFVLLALTLLTISTGALGIFFSYISNTFEHYGCVATITGLLNCMASLGLMLTNYVFPKIADEMGWKFTATCWLILNIISFVLVLISIPIWKRFVKKINQDNI